MTVDVLEGSGHATVSVQLTIDDDFADQPTSATHAIAKSGSVVTLADSATLDRDIAISWNCASGAPGWTLRRARPAGPESASAFGLLAIAPPSIARTHMPRDLVLLLDVSGSMSGNPSITSRPSSLH